MTMLLVIIWVILVIALVVMYAIRPERTRHSLFELERRADTAVLRREQLLVDVLALRRLVIILLVIGLTGIGIVVWKWWGVVGVVVAILLAVHLGRVATVHKRANLLYRKYESKLLDILEKFPMIGMLFGADHTPVSNLQLESIDQLLYLVESAGHILTNDQQAIILRGLDWYSIIVSSVMTPRSEIVSVKHSELLGPLVLHDLHESGHSVFPVIKKDIDHIIGAVDIVGLLQVDKMKSSHTAEHEMLPDVLTVTEDTYLPTALQMLVSSRKPFLIVLDADETTIGLVTLSDVLGVLLGKNRGEVVK